MRLTFITRKPQPRAPAVEPLTVPQAGGKSEGERPKELGGPSGPEPTRYGDWERRGICVDF